MSRTYRNTTLYSPDDRGKRSNRYGHTDARSWANRQRHITPGSRMGWLSPDGQWHEGTMPAKNCPWCDMTRNDKCFIHMSYHE